MMRGCDRPACGIACALLVALTLVVAARPARAQQQGQQSRERAQMMQMQQQLQRVQQDNTDLQGKLQKKDEDLKKESEAGGAARKQLSAARAEAAAKGKELEKLHAELDHLRELLGQAQSEIDAMKKVIASRDDALTQAGERERRDAEAQALLGSRLKLQTARSDRCETKHAAAKAKPKRAKKAKRKAAKGKSKT